MPDLLERLIRELRLEREHETLRRLSRRVGDDVELDRTRSSSWLLMREEASARPSYDRLGRADRRRDHGIRRAEGNARA